MSGNDLEQGMRLAGEGRLGEAEAALKRFVAANPRHAQALSILGALNLHQGAHEQALGYFERSLNIEPNQPQSWNGQGVCLFELGRFGEAVAAYDRALRLAPNFAPAHSNKGNALQRLLRYDEAIASYDAALALDPRFAAALSNRAGALVQTNRLNEALTSAERALALQPNDAEALARRGDALAGLKRFRDAVRSYDQALTLDPQLPQRLGNKLTALMTACQWDELDATRAALDAALQAGQCAADPFVLVFASNDPAQQRVAARLYAARFQPADAPPPLSAKSKIRIGYFSADFYSHATASLLTEMLELHDGTVFETYGFAFGDTPHDPWRERFERAFDHFHDVSSRSDADIAAFARAAELDIAIDLKGHTGKARTGIFAQRAAPIQVSWLGYPATMGARFIDYLIADPVLIREGEEHFYDEKIAFLPDTYQSNDRQRPVSGRTWTRAELGLPENGFVFCCFNNTYKITPDVFALWMRLLREVPDSVLWLLESNGEAKENLRAAATRQGVDAARLVFAPLIDMRDHLGRPAQANLFLDTFPCTAHTTASDALWAGLPVLTREGETFASRVAASVLRAAGLPDLITRTDEEYAALALGLARHRDRLTALRARLGANRQTSPLFDTPKFTREIEALYVRMVERQRAGAPPDHLRA